MLADAAPVEATTPERVSCMLHALWVRAELASDTRSWEAAVVSLRTLGPATAADLTPEAIDDVLGTATDRHAPGTDDVRWLWEAHRVLDADDDFERAGRRALTEGSDRAVADIVGEPRGIRHRLYSDLAPGDHRPDLPAPHWRAADSAGHRKSARPAPAGPARLWSAYPQARPRFHPADA